MLIGIHAETVCESLLLTFVLNFLLCSCFKCACVSKKDNDYINHIIAQELRKNRYQFENICFSSSALRFYRHGILEGNCGNGHFIL